MPIVEYKIIEVEGWKKEVFNLVSLFIPLPYGDGKYTPDFIIGGYGFISAVALGGWRVPLGLIMVLVAIIF
mgnify:CR=1 FL=1